MESFKRVLETIYRHPHVLYGTGDRHEKCFEKILLGHGINHLLPCYTGGYIRHPFGENRFPDFHLHLNRCIIPIELKSTRRTRCNIGDTWIKPECIYIISYPSNTFISLGRDMIHQKEEELYQKYYEDLRILRKKYATEEKRHIILYPRSSVQYTMLDSEKDVNYQKTVTYLEQIILRAGSVI
jgi:hypothetical protein